MQAWWIKFETGPKGCVEAKDKATALSIAEALTDRKPVGAMVLPYPAEPRLNKHEDPAYGICPSFCFRPDQCVGHTCCPQNYSCTE